MDVDLFIDWTYSDVISQLQGAVLILISQVDAVQVLKENKY